MAIDLLLYMQVNFLQFMGKMHSGTFSILKNCVLQEEKEETL